MLRDAVAGDEAFSIAAAERGLFAEIALECRAEYGDSVRFSFLCGRDAAERIVGWDYGRPNAVNEMLRDFDLLVAGRDGDYEISGDLGWAVRRLDVTGAEGVSATEVRERIARGAPWEHLVPAPAIDRVRQIYQSRV